MVQVCVSLCVCVCVDMCFLIPCFVFMQSINITHSNTIFVFVQGEDISPLVVHLSDSKLAFPVPPQAYVPQQCQPRTTG